MDVSVYGMTGFFSNNFNQKAKLLVRGVLVALRVPDVHEAQKQSSFMFSLIFFDQGSIDGKTEAKAEKCRLVAELKLKMVNLQEVTFSISTLLPGDTFELLTHISHLWTLGKKKYHSDF